MIAPNRQSFGTASRAYELLATAQSCRAEGGMSASGRVKQPWRRNPETAEVDPNRSSAPLTGCKMPKIPAD